MKQMSGFFPLSEERTSCRIWPVSGSFRSEGFSDFFIREDLPGFFNLAGIKSPGFTPAPAIARYIKILINDGITLSAPCVRNIS